MLMCYEVVCLPYEQEERKNFLSYTLSFILHFTNRRAASSQEVNHVWIGGPLISPSFDRKKDGGL